MTTAMIEVAAEVVATTVTTAANVAIAVTAVTVATEEIVTPIAKTAAQCSCSLVQCTCSAFVYRHRRRGHSTRASTDSGGAAAADRTRIAAGAAADRMHVPGHSARRQVEQILRGIRTRRFPPESPRSRRLCGGSP
jgi:hypothetical protein